MTQEKSYETKQSGKYKVKCQNPNCLFQFETNHPEIQQNKKCPICGNMNVKKEAID